jgi:methionine aminopeptidase type I
MPITIKTPEEIEKMRVAGRLAAEVLQVVAPHVKAGVTTEELDRICHDHIVNVQQAIPANVGYKGFPKTVCTSVNNVICHGIPSPGKVLKDGDIVNIDVTVIKDGWHGDTSRMYIVGTPSVMARRLVDVTRARSSRARPWATSATPSRSTPSPSASVSCASIAAMASAASTTRIRRCCTTAVPARAWC